MVDNIVKPIVSVIMPAYNCEKFIERAVESVLLQEVPLELIIINDCAKDGTEGVIQPYLSDERVHYIKNNRNLGVAETRNKGVRMAKGEYIAFLDSDDWWEKGKLEKQLELIRKRGVVLCSTGRELVDEEGRLTGRMIPVRETISYRMMLRQNWINCSSVLLRREVAEEFPMEHEDSHEDYITWLKILQKYHYACAINEPLLKYRLSSQGKSGCKLKSAGMTFNVYRYMGFSRARSIFYFICYAWNGIMKYMIK